MSIMNKVLIMKTKNETERKMLGPKHFHDMLEMEKQYKYENILREYYRRNCKYAALYETYVAEINRVDKTEFSIGNYLRARKRKIPPYYVLRKLAISSLYGQMVTGYEKS